MGYDVTSFQLKHLKNLIIPIKEFYTSPREHYHPVRTDNGVDGTVTFWFTDAGYIRGKIKGEFLYVDDIDDITDEFSDGAIHYVIRPALAHSAGEFEAILVWEGGDKIERLSSINGEVKSEFIEL